MIAELDSIRGSAARVSQIFAALGRRLAAAGAAAEVGRIVFDIADDLFGWDCGWLSLYYPEQDSITYVLAYDIVEGERRELPALSPSPSPTPLLRDVLAHGRRLVLRRSGEPATLATTAFGDRQRPSASLMLVPLRSAERVEGVLSVQSYREDAYGEADITLLEQLADHAGGAISRLKTEALLRRTEELYRRAIGGVGAVPYVYDFRSRSYVFMGEGIEGLTGYAPVEISPQLWQRIIEESVMAGQALGLDKQEAARRVRTGELSQWRCDMRIRTKEGKSAWVSDASIQTKDEEGRVTGSMGILQDITGRKQAELSALVYSRLGRELLSATTAGRVAQLMAAAARGLFRWESCAIHLCSPDLSELTSILRLENNGQAESHLSEGQPHPSSATELRALRGEATLENSPGGGCTMRVPIRLLEQTTGLVEFGSRLPDAFEPRDVVKLQSLVDYCGGAFERIRSEEAFRRAESQFRLVWDSSADGMRLTEASGRIFRVNEAYCRMVGKRREELEGQLLSVVYAPEEAEANLRTFVNRIASDSINVHSETEVTLWNGNKVWFDLSNSHLELPGRVLLLTIFRDVTSRKKAETELEDLHRKLIGVSRQAGMAEVATSVLHNVGNVLTSVNVSCSVLAEKLRDSKAPNLGKAAGLLEEHAADLGAFLASDPKGRRLPAYLRELSAHLERERQELAEEVRSLDRNIEHIKEIVTMQQNYARVIGVTEELDPVSLVEDALRLNAGALERHRIEIKRDFASLPSVSVDKHKVLQILVNLIRNAKYALDGRPTADKRLILRLRLAGPDAIQFVVEDNGVGIAPEHLVRIFEHGFTTRSAGHGFGLHNAAVAAREMEGSLSVHSDGAGRGARFTLTLPRRASSAR